MGPNHYPDETFLEIFLFNHPTGLGYHCHVRGSLRATGAKDEVQYWFQLTVHVHITAQVGVTSNKY